MENKNVKPKRTRRPKLNKEIQQLVDEVKAKVVDDDVGTKTSVRKKRDVKIKWDIPIDQQIYFFDTRLSYELTGYRPINDKEGLDFDPDWFTEVRETFKRTGHYCQHPRKSKAFADFWDEEYKKCMDGLTVNGYTITGDHYFFLNYYQLLDLTSTKKAGQGRMYDFPRFFVAQYEFFHYLEMCKRLRKNAVLMKARGVG